MIQTNEWQSTLSSDAIAFTQPEIMAKFIATIDSKDYPHLTMITSNWAIDSGTVKWGEFTYGESKKNVISNPKQGFLFMNVKMPFQFLQVKGELDHISTNGEDAADFNRMQLFRYNTYMRIYKTYFNKVVKARELRNIRLTGIVAGILANIFGWKGKTNEIGNRISKLGQKLFRGLIFPKFLSYIDSDGYPIIIPVFQARAVEQKRIIIPFSQFSADLKTIPVQSKVSLFAMDFETMSQMIKGVYTHVEKGRMVIDVNYVYNSMPPQMGEIYPNRPKMQKVTQFALH